MNKSNIRTRWKKKPSLVSWVDNGKVKTKVERDCDIACNLMCHHTAREETVRKYDRSWGVDWKEVY